MEFNGSNLTSNNQFAYFFSAVFFLFSSYFFISGSENLGLIFIFLCLLVFSIHLINSSLLTPFNKLWMQLGLLLGKIVSRIVLACMFFLVLTPLGIGMRIFKRDELRLKSFNFLSSWKLRKNNANTSHSFKNQY
tara:strand:+ start:218 stop:619 length:402 start_codon:yes stop_codon:yes gene_type:complete